MPVPNLWRTQQQRYRLRGQRCPVCSKAQFPPRQLCLGCGAEINAHSAEERPEAEFDFSPPTLPKHHMALVVAGDD